MKHFLISGLITFSWMATAQAGGVTRAAREPADAVHTWAARTSKGVTLRGTVPILDGAGNRFAIYCVFCYNQAPK